MVNSRGKEGKKGERQTELEEKSHQKTAADTTKRKNRTSNPRIPRAEAVLIKPREGKSYAEVVQTIKNR